MSFSTSVRRLLGFYQGSGQPSCPFTPNYKDVCQARALLKTLKLPVELVLQILDHAEYCPKHEFQTNPNQRKVAAPRQDRPSNAALCLDAGIFDTLSACSIRKGGEKVKIRSLEFEFTSQDQGWTTEKNITNTYSTSSWLEVSILRSEDSHNTHVPSPSSLNAWKNDPSDFHERILDLGWFLVKRPEAAKQGPQDGEGDFAWYLQGNRVAAHVDQYRVVWAKNWNEGNEGAGRGQGFLEELRDGDRILVWARAKWPGWQCIVASVRVTVRYKV